jgi:hypothetical protein
VGGMSRVTSPAKTLQPVTQHEVGWPASIYL